MLIDPGLLEIGRIFLERSGQFTLETITSAPAALDLIRAREFDAIISDYMMPDIDGIAFLKKVGGAGNSIPFISLTGRGCEEVAIQALNKGATYTSRKAENWCHSSPRSPTRSGTRSSSAGQRQISSIFNYGRVASLTFSRMPRSPSMAPAMSRCGIGLWKH